MLVNKEVIIADLARKYNLSERVVSDIVNSQFRFLAYIMQKGEFDGVQLPRLGKFHVKFERLKKLNLTGSK